MQVKTRENICVYLCVRCQSDVCERVIGYRLAVIPFLTESICNLITSFFQNFTGIYLPFFNLDYIIHMYSVTLQAYVRDINFTL